MSSPTQQPRHSNYPHTPEGDTACGVHEAISAKAWSGAQYVAVEPYHVMYRAEEYHQQYLSKYGGGYTGGYGLM